MREIKFRAWDNGKKDNDSYTERMSEPFNISDGMVLFDGDMIITEMLKDIDLSNEGMKRFKIMQYTGLKDKNGIEIYDGDIIKATYGTALNSDITKGEVCMDYFSWSLSRNGMVYETFDDLVDNNCIIEVIGNIYENKDLLCV